MMSAGAPPALLDVVIRELPPQSYLGKRVHAALAAVGPEVQRGLADLFTRLAAAHVAPVGMPFVIASEPRGGAMDIELGVPCGSPPAAGPLYAATLPGGRVAVTTHRGPYEEIAPVYAALNSWIRANGHSTSGPPREVYLTGPQEVASPADHVTELVWPIE